MSTERQLITHWLNSGDPAFLAKNGISEEFFIALREQIDWIKDYYSRYKTLPLMRTLATEFDDVVEMVDLEPVGYLSDVLRNDRLYQTYRPALIQLAQDINGSSSSIYGVLLEHRQHLDAVLKDFSPLGGAIDWVSDSMDRYLRYMEIHGKDVGLRGITTGIASLDVLTGGWEKDDFVLVTGRLNEGKSFVALYFAYIAWFTTLCAGVKKPVVYVSTEMPYAKVAQRLDTMHGHFSSNALRDGKLENADNYREFTEALAKKDCGFYVLTEADNGGRPFVPTDIQGIIARYDPCLLVIDQLYDISDGTNETDIRKQIVRVTGMLRDINLNTCVPMIVVSQSGRGAVHESKKDKEATPELHHIQESDNPAQKATKVVTLRLVADDLLKLSLKKNRDGKRNVDMFMKVQLDTGYWEEASEESAVF